MLRPFPLENVWVVNGRQSLFSIDIQLNNTQVNAFSFYLQNPAPYKIHLRLKTVLNKLKVLFSLFRFPFLKPKIDTCKTNYVYSVIP